MNKTKTKEESLETVTKSRAVLIFEALGFKTAGKWDAARLQKKLTKLDSLIEGAELDAKTLKRVNQILRAQGKGRTVTVVDPEDAVADKVRDKEVKEAGKRETDRKVEKKAKRGKKDTKEKDRKSGKSEKKVEKDQKEVKKTKTAEKVSAKDKKKKENIDGFILKCLQKKPHTIDRLLALCVEKWPDKADSLGRTVPRRLKTKYFVDKCNVKVVVNENGAYSIES